MKQEAKEELIKTALKPFIHWNDRRNNTLRNSIRAFDSGDVEKSMPLSIASLKSVAPQHKAVMRARKQFNERKRDIEIRRLMLVAAGVPLADIEDAIRNYWRYD